MYSTCIHCNSSLGTNDFIEHFPVGQRIAFDAQLGRLWAVCRRCERWNLAPFEERWEAIEECERAYKSTRVRVSTDNIALARLRDGTELVRIGKPARPEFAAWRYGDQFNRRRMRTIAIGTGIAGAAGFAAFGMVAASVSLVAMVPVFQMINMAVVLSLHGVHLNALPNPAGGYFRPAGNPKLVERPDVEEGWGIEIGYAGIPQMEKSTSIPVKNSGETGRLHIRGNDASTILRRVLPRANRGGASRQLVAESVQLIENAGDPREFGRWAAGQRRKWGALQTSGDTGDFSFIPASARLAFEMAVFEEDERRALQGELSQLERAWQEAEAVAGIADKLQVPRTIQARYNQLRGKRDQG